MKRIAVFLAIGTVISACSSTPREPDAQGDFYFVGDSLAYIAGQFNRLNKIQIHVLGARAAQRRYTGRVPFNEPHTFALVLRHDRTLCVDDKADVILVRETLTETDCRIVIP